MAMTESVSNTVCKLYLQYFKDNLYSFGVNQALHLKKLQYFVKNT